MLKRDEELDAILAGTKFSSMTKSLRTYYNAGVTPALEQTLAWIKDDMPQLRPARRLAFALYIRNYILNGATGLIPGAVTDKSSKALMVTLPAPRVIYSRVRPNTLDRWEYAAEGIDLRKSAVRVLYFNR